MSQREPRSPERFILQVGERQLEGRGRGPRTCRVKVGGRRSQPAAAGLPSTPEAAVFGKLADEDRALSRIFCDDSGCWFTRCAAPRRPFLGVGGGRGGARLAEHRAAARCGPFGTGRQLLGPPRRATRAPAGAPPVPTHGKGKHLSTAASFPRGGGRPRVRPPTRGCAGRAALVPEFLPAVRRTRCRLPLRHGRP